MRTYPGSEQLFEQSRQVTPGGAQTASKAPGRVGPLGAFPLYASHGDGCDLFDVDGHRYVDWFNGNCAVTLGHNHPDVTRAVCQQLHLGTLLSLPTSLEEHVARRLTEVIPCAEQVRFVKTGSEACAAAVRLARMATGREIILTPRNHYHGWHDWTVIRNAHHPGIPAWMVEGIRTVTYGSTEELVEAFDMDETREIAAVMLEPVQADPPPPGYLADLVELAHAHGSLVIFDEMITGGRLRLAGAQEFFGVVPDLATFGKAFANGMPLAFVAGRADLMQHAGVVSGTFGGEALSLAACDAVLDVYPHERAIARMWQVGQQLMDGVNGICARLELPARMEGYPCRPMLRWSVGPGWSPVVVALLQQEIAQAGVLAHPSGWNPSAALTSEALEQTLAGCNLALSTVAAALASNVPELFLRGGTLAAPFARAEVKT